MELKLTSRHHPGINNNNSGTVKSPSTPTCTVKSSEFLENHFILYSSPGRSSSESTERERKNGKTTKLSHIFQRSSAVTLCHQFVINLASDFITTRRAFGVTRDRHTDLYKLSLGTHHHLNPKESEPYNIIKVWLMSR